MLKLARFLERYRSAVLAVLLTPILGLFLSSDFHLEMVPANPHLEFLLSFEVPARTAEEISQRTVEPVEKILNGLPGLLGMESAIEDERAQIHLRFDAATKVNVAYLNIQEKMDRIRLILPRDVEKTAIDFIQPVKPATLEFQHPQGMSRSLLNQILAQHQGVIQKTEPPLEQSVQIVVEPDPQRLAENKMSVSQVVQALKALGLSSSLGRRQGLLFETTTGFTSIENLRAALVGAVGHRPLRLSDVAHIRVESQSPITRLALWLDPTRANKNEIRHQILQAYPQATSSSPRLRAMISQSLHPILLIAICFLLQILVVWIVRLPLKAMIYVGATGLIVAIHFLFWKGLVAPPLTVIDLHALALTLMVGSLFLPVLYIRIRSYFSQTTVIPRSPKTLEQAKLFAMAELLPTFLVLSVALWISSLPILSSTVNLPSRFVLESFFYLGLPLLLSILLIAPLSTQGDFLLHNIGKPRTKMFWNLSARQAQIGTWSLVALAAATLLLFQKFDLGVSYRIKDDLTQKMVQNLRGYSNQLWFKASGMTAENLAAVKYEYADRNLFESVRVREFTASGMRYLNRLDLIGFVSAMKEVQGQEPFGYVAPPLSTPIPLHFSAQGLSADWIPSLFFAAKDSLSPSISIDALTTARFEQKPARIVRDNMIEGDRVRPQADRSRGSFQPRLDSRIFPTPWTDYLLKQYRDFQTTQWLSLIFVFLLFAIYLNSFIRSALVVFFALATTGFVLLVRGLIPETFHSDSLWLLQVGTFLALFQILVSARIIDIERSRGSDRDLCIEEIKREFAPTVFLCSITFVIAIFVGGLTEFIPFLPAMGFWKEGVVLALLMAAILVYSAHILFALFYLSSEEFLDRWMFRAYRSLTVWRRLRKR